jgi:hypothetical protein
VEWTGRSEKLSFWRYTAPGRPTRETLRDERVDMRVVHGSIAAVRPEGHVIETTVGNGKLKLYMPVAAKYPLIELFPSSEGGISIEVSPRSAGDPEDSAE